MPLWDDAVQGFFPLSGPVFGGAALPFWGTRGTAPTFPALAAGDLSAKLTEGGRFL